MLRHFVEITARLAEHEPDAGADCGASRPRGRGRTPFADMRPTVRSPLLERESRALPDEPRTARDGRRRSTALRLRPRSHGPSGTRFEGDYERAVGELERLEDDVRIGHDP